MEQIGDIRWAAVLCLFPFRRNRTRRDAMPDCHSRRAGQDAGKVRLSTATPTHSRKSGFSPSHSDALPAPRHHATRPIPSRLFRHGRLTPFRRYRTAQPPMPDGRRMGRTGNNKLLYYSVSPRPSPASISGQGKREPIRGRLRYEKSPVSE